MTKRTTPRRVKALPVTFSRLRLPLWSIPRTRSDYDAMVRQLTVALFRADPEPHWTKNNLDEYYAALAIAALKSIGITRPRE